MLISSIGLLEPIQNQDHGIIPGCSGNPYRFIHTKCPLSRLNDTTCCFALPDHGSESEETYRSSADDEAAMRAFKLA